MMNTDTEITTRSKIHGKNTEKIFQTDLYKSSPTKLNLVQAGLSFVGKMEKLHF
tara:strand:- start:260 stop:421 length:162 start_codon:yes stop_codon:yes gene_type:complete